MIRLEFPKFNIDGLQDKEKLSTIKRQLDTLTNNIQLVLESISGDVETLSEFVGNSNEAENSENITSITEIIRTLQSRDYIAEEGTDGIWTYRKWNSGIAECWGTAEISGLSWSSYTTGGIATNYNSTPAQVPMPSDLFTEIDSINANTLYAGSNIGWVANTTYSATAVLLTFIRNGNTGVMRAFINIKGKWK